MSRAGSDVYVTTRLIEDSGYLGVTFVTPATIGLSLPKPSDVHTLIGTIRTFRSVRNSEKILTIRTEIKQGF